MNQYEKSFYEDIREKKKAATGAYHRATRGKRSFTVHNQSDHLTKKELKEMSGEVVSFMQKPIVWHEFKEMPVEAQRRYIEWLKKEYKVTGAMISDMFGVNRATFCNYNKEVLWLSFPNSNKPNEATKKRWQEFCGGEKEIFVKISEEPEQEKPCGKIKDCNLSAETMEELRELLGRIEPVLALGKLSVHIRVENERSAEWI